MRFPASLNAQTEESNSMSAMTDVVFLLLIFFIVTMSSYVEMTLLETNLPTSSGTAPGKVDLQNSLKIELSASGEYIINGIPQSRENLNRLLRRYARLMPDAEFLLACNPNSKHYMLVTLLADFAKHKLKNVKLMKS
jgi:biopolymer transport protein ExbD